MTYVAWILGIAFLIACPQALPVALAVVAWLLTAQVGTAVLGALFLTSLVYVLGSGMRGYGARRAW